MQQSHSAGGVLTRKHLVPVLGFAAVIIGLAAIAWLAIASLASDYAEYAAAADLLERLEGRRPPIGSSGHASGMPGSPFLEGPTVNVAGAELQQRVAAAVRNAGGNVLSSQIDLQGSQARPGYVSLSASCELEESALQPLIYDLETGMPFLFIDQLVVQVPQTGVGIGSQLGVGLGPEAGPARMRVQIDISGQWRVRK
ncbi:MAG: type II secretion system protein GspM [Beijerinckiaceae bacterium]|nr:type II secretion system protein GspM [Beijerinckiaceae bacterium]MCI0736097.1 type II secretion system protein GspM [Beijerinckiaceae bacterium]